MKITGIEKFVLGMIGFLLIAMVGGVSLMLSGIRDAGGMEKIITEIGISTKRIAVHVKDS